MTCSERQKFIHAYIDGELDLAASIELEQHLDTCNACFETYKRHSTLQKALKQHVPYYDAPLELQRRINTSVYSMERARPRLFRIPKSYPRILALAASFAVVALISWSVG